MRESYFGDSYDVVKQSLLRWLQPFGDWEVHPMFSVPASSAFISAFGTFLNAKVISEDVLTSSQIARSTSLVRTHAATCFLIRVQGYVWRASAESGRPNTYF